jgi:hypothetical protein
MKHTAFAFGLASLVAGCAAQPRHIAGAPAGSLGRLGAPPVIQPVLAVSAELAMTVDDVHAWLEPTIADAAIERRTRKRHERAHRHDPAVRAGLLLAPAPGQHHSSLQRPLLGRDARPMSGNVMKKNKGKAAADDWTTE